MKKLFKKPFNQNSVSFICKAKRKIFVYICFSMFCIQNVFSIPVTISSTTTWNSGTTLPMGPLGNPDYRDGIIITGGEFTIDGITLTFRAGKSITVESGCELIIISATLTATTTWQGIIANGKLDGTTVFDQYLTYPEIVANDNSKWLGVLDPAQTLVEVTGSSHINNAAIGIESNHGAIVQTTGGEFLDCNWGIYLNTYTSPGKQLVNACRMMGTTFKWTNSFPISFSNASIVGIRLIAVQGIRMGGCTFINDMSTKHCEFDRGIGIFASNNSNFGLAHSGTMFCQNTTELNCLDNCNPGSPPAPGDGNTFTKLSYGIKQWGDSDVPNTCATIIKFCNFTHNLNDIYIEYAGKTLIKDNTFTKSRSNLNSLFLRNGIDVPDGNGCQYTGVFNLTSIHSTNSFPVQIIKNTFTFTAKDCKVIYMENSSSTQTQKSKIRSNTFTNNSSGTIKASDNVTGIWFTGGNNNMEVHCNEFNDHGVDIYNEDGVLSDFIISNQAVKNVFSGDVSPDTRYRLSNDGTSFLYEIKSTPTPARENPTGFISGTVTTHFTTQKDCNLTCQEIVDETLYAKNVAKAYNNFIMFPNPTNKETNIIISNGYIKQILLYSLDGKLIKNIIDIDDSDYVLDITDLPSGSYTVIVMDNHHNLIPQKLMVY